MGLLKHLLFWPVTGPAFLTRFSLEKVSNTVREELTDDQSVKEDLLELQIKLELGEIDDEQYAREEAMLMQRLRDVREWREEFGMGMAGGPVRVARSTDEPSGAETAPATPGRDDRPSEEHPGSEPGRGISLPQGAEVEVRFDWEEG